MDAFVFLSHRKPATGRTSDGVSESVDLLTRLSPLIHCYAVKATSGLV